jgi:hypothetical protein
MANLVITNQVRVGQRQSEKNLNPPANKASVFQKIQRQLAAPQVHAIEKRALSPALD